MSKSKNSPSTETKIEDKASEQGDVAPQSQPIKVKTRINAGQGIRKPPVYI